jgi:hypothetical protein
MTSSILIKCWINFAPHLLGLMIALAMCLTLQTYKLKLDLATKSYVKNPNSNSLCWDLRT